MVSVVITIVPVVMMEGASGDSGGDGVCRWRVLVETVVATECVNRDSGNDGAW